MKKIRERARQLLIECGITSAPVNVERIAALKGVEIKRTQQRDDISGFLLNNGHHVVIGVNTWHHPNRQRFTIAHELGHYLLHKHDSVHVDRYGIKLRSEASSKGEDAEEIEANRFAAELLMPVDFLRGDLQKFVSERMLTDAALQRLAKLYQVSVQAMTTRLTSLRIINSTEALIA